MTPADPGAFSPRAAGGVQCDEDRLPFADGAFDLVVSVGALDTVNDLPGALPLIRRALRPDGLFLAAFAGAGSLPRLRRAMLAAEEAERRDAASPHIHPQIDVRAAGDLLGRAGFALPVVDGETVDRALRIAAEARRRPAGDGRDQPPRRPLPAAVRPARPRRRGRRFRGRRRADGKTAERFEIVHLSGWAPAPDQPQAGAARQRDRVARRGAEAAGRLTPSQIRASSSAISGSSAGGIATATISPGRTHLSPSASSGRGSPRHRRQT